MGLPPDDKSENKRGEKAKYAKAHGVFRGGLKKLDNFPEGHVEDLQVDSSLPDEGLLVFIQTTLCRRHVWVLAFDKTIESLPERASYAQHHLTYPKLNSY